jgi:hypothetical protein
MFSVCLEIKTLQAEWGKEPNMSSLVPPFNAVINQTMTPLFYFDG